MTGHIITDKILIENLETHFKKIQFHPKIAKPLREWLKFLKTLDEFKDPKFSLFEYVTISKRLQKENPKNNKILQPYQIWEFVLQGSIDILKRYDIRENPSFHNESIETEFSNDLPRTEDIVLYYQKAVEFEKILYGTDPWYRDHFAHVLRVWLLGIFVIFELKNKILSPLFDTYDDLDNKLFSPQELFASYSIAALTHDLGYPLQKLKKLNKKIGEILDSFGGINWNEINANLSISRHDSALLLLKFLSSKVTIHHVHNSIFDQGEVKELIEGFLRRREGFKTLTEYQADRSSSFIIFLRSQYKFHQKYFDSLEKYEHGFISALLLHRKLLYFKEGEFAIEEDYPFNIEEARQFLLRREILRSITTHTSEDIYIIKLLSLDSLLFFTDEIQEWGRPFFSDIYGGTINNTKPTVTLNAFNNKEVDWEVEAAPETPMKDCLFWLLSVSRKYMVRFRSAPEEGEREFICRWQLKWILKEEEFTGEYFFHNNSNTQHVKITNTTKNKEVDLCDSMKDLDRGSLSIADLRDSILSSKEMKEII